MGGVLQTPTWLGLLIMVPMEHLLGRAFEQATVFEPGYAAGYLQSEVKELRFVMAVDEWGKEHFAARFVGRGKRKARYVGVAGLVVISGWGHPELEVWVEEPGPPGVVSRRGRFTSFSREWDGYLDEYLARIRPEIIVDGRARPPDKDEGRVKSPVPAIPPVEPARFPDEVGESALWEGAKKEVLVNRYERNEEARRVCLAHHGAVCQACEADMGSTYGPLGEGYVHVHHKVPLSEIGEGYVVDPINDLVPVCPNCHAMLHRPERVLTVEELRAIISSRRA